MSCQIAKTEYWKIMILLSDTKCCHLEIHYVLPKDRPGPNLHFHFIKNCIHTTLLGSLAPTILKNWAPCFLKIRHPAFWKKNRVQKTKVIVIQKEKRQPGLFSFRIKDDPVFFSLLFAKKQVAPFFKKQGAQFLRIVGADWLGDCGA